MTKPPVKLDPPKPKKPKKWKQFLQAVGEASGKGTFGSAVMFLSGITLTGCGGPIVNPSVYGASGKAYQAPTICSALVQCLKTEANCYYDSYTVATSAGETTDACKVIKK